jgi:excisionase family DNA binding protein
LHPKRPRKPRNRHQLFPTRRDPSDQHPARPSKDRNDSPRFAEIFATNLLPPIEQLLTVRQVAQFLGVCTATVYKWAASGVLPHVRIVNVIRIRPEDLTRFVAERSP